MLSNNTLQALSVIAELWHPRDQLRVRNADGHQKVLSLGANALQSLIAHLCKSWFCWKAAGGQQQPEKDESAMFAAEIPGLPWSLCCVDLFDFANPPCPLMFPNSIPWGRPSLEDRL